MIIDMVSNKDVALFVNACGEIYSMGINSWGLLGLGEYQNETRVDGGIAPLKLELPEGEMARSVKLGKDHALALCVSGKVFGWGNNQVGQVGVAMPEVKETEQKDD